MVYPGGFRGHFAFGAVGGLGGGVVFGVETAFGGGAVGVFGGLVIGAVGV